jgi:KDO2-lipid IV(A) lauroyltransferase
MSNVVIDRYMKYLRTKTGEVVYTMKNSFRDIVSMKHNNERYVLALVADQTPGKQKIQYVTSFLNQNTPVHMGLEKMAKKLNDVVIFTKVEKVKRGHYKVTVVPMFENAKETGEHEITDAAMKNIEEVIYNRPEYWLWSHKRWKHVDNRELSMPAFNGDFNADV